MAIINNAHAGSQINLLCMIYRVIHRNNGKLSIEDISTLCCPQNLVNRQDHIKRFPDNLKFWTKPEHQLWDIDSSSKLSLTIVSNKKELLPPDIAIATNKALFKVIVSDICNGENHDTKMLFCCLASILASDQFIFLGQSKIDKKALGSFFSQYFSNNLPNDSERPTLIEYGYFLGFFEQQNEAYIADPTRAILGVLVDIFQTQQILSINAFISRLSELLPVLDRGVYRQEVEEIMLDKGWEKNQDSYLSKSLSQALFRLSRMKKIKFKTTSDDTQAVNLVLPNNKTQLISSIQYINGEQK